MKKKLGIVYIFVEYGDFIKAENICLFTNYLQERIGTEKCPTKENDYIDSKYAILDSGISYSNIRFVKFTRDDWYDTVNAVNNLKVYKNNNYIFYSYKLYMQKGDTWIEIFGNSSIYYLANKKKYKLVLYYIYPSINIFHQAKIEIKNTEGISLLNNNYFYIDLYSDKIDILFETLYYDSNISSIVLSTEDAELSDIPIHIRIKKSKRNSIITLVVLLIYALMNFVAMEMHIDVPVSIYDKIINFLPNVITSFTLYFLFKLNGENSFL